MRHCIFRDCRLAIGLALIGALAIVATPRFAAAAHGVVLAHFKCYGVLSAFEPAPRIPDPFVVTLDDQFNSSLGLLEDVEVKEALRFCNPVEKKFLATTTSILSATAPPTFYAYGPRAPTAPLPTIIGEVAVFNQFGDQILDIESANILAVPTQKLEPNPHAVPTDLDHFKCYFAKGETPKGKSLFKGLLVVELSDQLESLKHKLIEPLLFCNPVQKTDPAGVVIGVDHPLDHLTCYTLSTLTATNLKEVVMRNQINSDDVLLEVGFGDLLCVPSEKVDFKVTVVP